MSTQTTADPQVLVPASTERVQFRDGQLVDADALTTAMMFPVSLLQVVLRSYLGCGIVCGLEVVRPDEERACVRIRPGVMVDCHGFPVELCREVVLDLTPDPCACETEARELCILMRRATSEDASRRPCGGGCGGGCSGGCSGRCGCSGGAHDDCNRVRDQVLIKAVDLTALDDARDHVCETTVDDAEDDAKDGSGSGGSGTPVAKAVAATVAVGADADADCACLTACAERCCAERSWVLLACVTVIPAPDDGCASGYTLSEVDSTRRKYVKPIECCRSHHRETARKTAETTETTATTAAAASTATAAKAAATKAAATKAAATKGGS
jgi:hypothetical protein